jgi:hypothetical protein
MPSASIRSQVNSLSPISGGSRDDLKAGDVVTLESVNVHTTYAWTMAFKPAGSTATFSGSPVAATPGSFTVDKEGPYLIRLTADLGLGTESTQFVRLRYLTVFGELKLVAAGEGYGGSIPVPVDIGATGWSDQQNYNHQMVLGLLARISTSGRMLYVDSNEGTHMTSGRVVVQTTLTAGDLVSINGVVLTGNAGPRTSGANDFNANLNTTPALATNIAAAINDPLNGFASSVSASASGNVVTLTPISGRIVALSASTTPAGGITVGQGYADYTLVQEAINAAEAAGAGVNTPYLIMVRPGLYTENLNFKPFVHVFGADGNPSGTSSQRAVVLRGSHTVTTTVNSDLVVLGRLTLENITSGTATTVTKNGLGTVNLYRCDVEQQGLGAAQGPAFRLNRGVASLDYCTVAAHSSLADDRSAITQPGGNASTLYVRGCVVRGPTGLTLNSGLGASILAEVYDSRIVASGATGVGIISDNESLLLEYTNVSTASGIPLQVHPGAALTPNPIGATLRWSYLDGPISFDTTNIGGATTLQVGSSEYTGFTLPGGTPSVMAATTKATSLFYDPTLSGMTAQNVQDAIDEAYAAAILVRTLDDAYDGGVPNSGSGRTIVADQGSVQIVDAPVTADPPPADNANGQLEVVAAVKVGALGFPEIRIDPNPYGSGPSILFGNRVIPPNIPFGVGTAMVMGQSTGTPLYRNYNLRVQTQSSDGGGAIGRLILQGGDGLDNGLTTPDASSVFIQAGTSFNVTAAPGSVFVAPGRRQGGLPGSIVFVRPAGNTPATLTAAGACTSPLGVTGNVTFATNMGAVTASLLSTDNLAAVVAKLDALEGVSASEVLGVITLTTDHEGPNAEVYFLSADPGVDAALGLFNGQSQVDGTYGSYIAARVTADHEITIGVGGVTGPLVYNADTGKLTVPGLIDPTGLVFEEAGAPGTGATEGALFVSDGSGGLILGDLYYQGPGSAVPVSVGGGGGGGESLAATLAIGNTTGGTDLVVSSGDGLILTEAATPPTTVASQGAFFVGGGTAPYANNVLYWVPESAGTPVPLSLVTGSSGTLLHRLQIDASSPANIQAATAFGFDVAAITTNPADGDTLVIDDSFNPAETYTFRAAPTLAFEVLIDALDVRNTLTNLVETINRDSTQNVAVKVTDLTRLQTNNAVRGQAAVIVTLTTASSTPRMYGTFTPGTNPRARDFSLNQSRYDTDNGWQILDSVDPGTKKYFGYAVDGFTLFTTASTLTTASSPTVLVRQIHTPTTLTLWLSPSDRLVNKQPCRVATTGNIASFTTATNTIDGVTLQTGDRVLVWQQTVASQNGIYEVRAAGSGADGKWVRASDFKTFGVFAGTRVFIQEGSANGQTFITVTTTGTILVGVTSLAFVQEAPLVRTDASSTEIIASTPFTAGTFVWSDPVNMRDHSEVSVWFNPTDLTGPVTSAQLAVQWSDDGTTIPFDSNNGVQLTDFLLSSGTDGNFPPKFYVAGLSTAGPTPSLVVGQIMMLSYPKKGGSFRFGVMGDFAGGAFSVRAQRLA